MSAIDDLISGGSPSPAPAMTVAAPTTRQSGGSAIDALLSGSQAPTGSLLQSSAPQKFANPNVPTQYFKGQQIPSSIPTKNLVNYDSSNGYKTFSLPDFAGGGVYTEDKNGTPVKAGHTTYGGVATQSGMQRDDIIPQSLGGANSQKGNIRMVPMPIATQQDKIETQLSKQVKQGQIQPKAAITEALSQKADIANNTSFWQGIGDALGNVGRGIKTGAKMIVGKTQSQDAFANPATSFIQLYSKPSEMVQQAEKNMSNIPIFKQAGQAVLRTLIPMVEGFGVNVGGDILGQNEQSDALNKNQTKQTIGTSVQSNVPDTLVTHKLTSSEVLNVALNTINVATLFAPLLSEVATKGTLKIADSISENSKVPISYSDMQKITTSTSQDQAVSRVGQVKLDAYKEATQNATVRQALKQGYVELAKKDPGTFATILKNAATNPLTDIGNIAKGSTEQYANPNVKPSAQTSETPARQPFANETVARNIESQQTKIQAQNSPNITPQSPKTSLETVIPKVGNIDPLTTEAQKYKSAEEFVRAQGETLYHGTSAKFEPQDIREGVYLTKDKNYAGVYQSPNASSLTVSNEQALNKRGGTPRTIEYVIPKSAKIFDATKPADLKLLNDYWKSESTSGEFLPTATGQLDWTEIENVTDYLKQKGYKFDGIKVGEGGGIDPHSKMQVKRADSIKILNPKILQTKSQLTDIWNKANGKPELPTPKKESSSVSLNSGFDPGVDKFIAEDVKPAVQASVNATKSALGFVKKIGNGLVNVFDRGASVQKYLGDKAYSDAIKAIHTPDAEAITFDNNFHEAQKYFDKFSNKDLQNFNLTRGEASSPEAQTLQKEAKSSIHPELGDPKINAAIKQASDYVLKLANENGLNIKEFKDYFYGVYKSEAGKINSFLDHWSSTDKYTKEKAFPTPADAVAYGLELKHQNPITNIKAELQAVAKRVGLIHLKESVQNSEFVTTQKKATIEQKKDWAPISDPVFKDMLFHPSYAKLVNNLISTNKVSQNFGLKALRQTARVFSTIKFYGSIFHQTNMLKAAISDVNGGVFNFKAKGLVDFAKGLKSIDKTTPQYKEYVSLGGGHQYSLEVEAQTQLHNAVDRIMRGNYLGGLVRGGLSLSTEMGGYNQWLFDKFIPAIKYNSYQYKLSQLEAKGNITDAQKINIIKENQNIYGEMNERLFGRSGTATSVLRLLFTAPGYGEGNFRMIGNAIAGEGWQGKARAASFMFKSLLTTLTAAVIGTRLATGQWPTEPKTLKDIRDLFKIQTNAKDGNGDQVMVDLMSFDKDYWSVYGNAAIGKPGNIGTALTSRISGMFSTPFKGLTDIASILEGKTLVDFKNSPIYSQTDTFQQKMSKFWKYELSTTLPISFGTFQTAKTKGTNISASIVQALTGFRPTTSEQAKEVKAARADYFSMQTDKKNKQIQLNALYKTNPEEAIKQAKEFNKLQMQKVKNILKIANSDQTTISKKEWGALGIININPKTKDTSQGTTVRSFLSP